MQIVAMEVDSNTVVYENLYTQDERQLTRDLVSCEPCQHQPSIHTFQVANACPTSNLGILKVGIVTSSVLHVPV